MGDSRGTRGRNWARVLSACALTAAGLALAACAGPAHHAGSPASTSHSASPSTSPRVVQPVVLNPSRAKPAKQDLFAPYDENGALTVSAAPGTAGECFATSIAVPVAGVFRCLAANEILDPCFAPVHESSPLIVTCFADPWSAGQTIAISGALPEYDPVLTQGDPWGIELTNGVHCVSVTGAIPSLGGVDLTYRCDGSTVAGLTSADNGVLIAHYGPDTGPLSDVAVSVAWRGRSFRIGGTA